MKSITFLLMFTSVCSFAQKQSFDLVSFNAPKGWVKKSTASLISYTFTDKKDKSWCQQGIYKSRPSKGSIEEDFAEEWNELVVRQYHITDTPRVSGVEEAEGWKIKSGSGKFIFNNKNAAVLLTTFSGYGICISIIAVTGSQRYFKDVEDLIGSVELKKPGLSTTSSVGQNTSDKKEKETSRQTASSNFFFSTTNFDDGWTSTVKEDWVEVTKGSMKVLLHYPKEGTIFPADPGPLTNTAWNILVAPRYSNLKNYKTAYISTYDRPYLGMGYATENATGKNVFIVFFHQGNTGWLEFVAPDKSSFMQQYKFDPETIQWDSNSDLMVPLANMTGYNKFAVAASDLKGKWTSDFTGIQQLYNVYTGQYAGMNMNQSNEEFIFNEGNSYNWKLLAVNGMVGNAKFTEVKSAGQFSVPNNWQIHFSKIESSARTFNAFWSCIKGARVLNLLDANAPGAGIYTKYGLAK